MGVRRDSAGRGWLRAPAVAAVRRIVKGYITTFMPTLSGSLFYTKQSDWTRCPCETARLAEGTSTMTQGQSTRSARRGHTPMPTKGDALRARGVSAPQASRPASPPALSSTAPAGPRRSVPFVLEEQRRRAAAAPLRSGPCARARRARGPARWSLQTQTAATLVLGGHGAWSPGGLGDGDSFRLLFIGTSSTNASSSDIADYNELVVQNLVFDEIRPCGHPVPTAQASGCLAAPKPSMPATTRHDGHGRSASTGIGGAKVADDYADFYDGGWDEEARRKKPDSARCWSLATLGGSGRAAHTTVRKRWTAPASQAAHLGNSQQCLGQAGQPQQQYQPPRPHRERHGRLGAPPDSGYGLSPPCSRWTPA